MRMRACDAVMQPVTIAVAILVGIAGWPLRDARVLAAAAKPNATKAKKNNRAGSPAKRPGNAKKQSPNGRGANNGFSQAVSQAQQTLRSAIAAMLQAEQQLAAATARYQELQRRLLGASRRHEDGPGLSRDEREMLQLQRRLDELRAEIVARVRETPQYKQLAAQAERVKQQLDEARKRPDSDPAELLVLSREYARLHASTTAMETQAADADPEYRRLREELLQRGKSIGEDKRSRRDAAKSDPEVQQLVQQVQQAKKQMAEAERMLALRRQQVQMAELQLARVVQAAQIAAAQQRLRQQGRGKGGRGRSRGRASARRPTAKKR